MKIHTIMTNKIQKKGRMRSHGQTNILLIYTYDDTAELAQIPVVLAARLGGFETRGTTGRTALHYSKQITSEGQNSVDTDSADTDELILSRDILANAHNTVC